MKRDGQRDAAGSWIDLRARDGEVAVALALLATVLAVVNLRHRRDLWIGSGLLSVVLATKAYVGALIPDDGKDTLTAVRTPLGMLARLVAGVRGPRGATGLARAG